MLGLLIYTLAGVILGALTSLIPGIHINTIAAMFLGAFYEYSPDPMPLAFLILGMAIAHSFVGFVPSIFLGAPNEGTVLSIAPGHRMLKKGRGYEALYLAVSGGLAGIILLAAVFPMLAKIIPAAYEILRPVIHYVLIAAVALMIVKEKRKGWALFVFLLSSAFGVLALGSKINSSFVLLPMLSGLFGISTLVLSKFSESAIPRQSKKVGAGIKRIIPASLSGLLGGIIAGLLPGIGSSQSAIIASEFTRQKGPRGFMVMLGAISATDILLSILALNLIGNPRSGAAVAIGAMLGGELGRSSAVAFIGAGVFAAGISAFVAMKLGAKFSRMASGAAYGKAVNFAILAIFAVILYFTGLGGILVAVLGALIGSVPHFAGVKKSLLLGCLIFPTILYFFGISLL